MAPILMIFFAGILFGWVVLFVLIWVRVVTVDEKELTFYIRKKGPGK